MVRRESFFHGIVLLFDSVASEGMYIPPPFNFVPSESCTPSAGQPLDQIAAKCITDAISGVRPVKSFEYQATSRITPLKPPTYCEAGNHGKLGYVRWLNRTAGDDETYQMRPRSLVLVGLPEVDDFPCAMSVWLKPNGPGDKPECSLDRIGGDVDVLYLSHATKVSYNETIWELLFEADLPAPKTSDPAKATIDLIFNYTACAALTDSLAIYTRHVFDFARTGDGGGDSDATAVIGRASTFRAALVGAFTAGAIIYGTW